jgi:hypothetical protein
MDMARAPRNIKTDASVAKRKTVDGQKPKWRALIDALESGMSLRSAAALAGSTYGSAKVMLHKHRNRLIKGATRLPWAKLPRAPVGSGRGETVTIRISSEVSDELRREAKKRGMTRNKLIATALSVMVKDDLLNAVMEADDERK